MASTKRSVPQAMTYEDSVHLWGRIWTASAIFMFLMVPLAISVRYQAFPPFQDVLKGLLGVAPVFWTVGIIEVLTYAPMLGTGGTYLAFVTGSLSTLKVPCALNAMEGAGAKAGTEEAEVISTIAIATSSLVTTLVIALGVFGIRFLQPVLENPGLKPAFDAIMPALMGALGLVYISKNWKLAIAPLLFMICLFLLMPSLSSSVGILVPVGAIIAYVAGRLMQRGRKD